MTNNKEFLKTVTREKVRLNMLGLDEAGRGPVIGPMIIAGVLIKQENVVHLNNIGVRDSKLLAPNARKRLADKIRQVADKIKIIEVSPKEVDNRVALGISLNTLEAKYMSEIIVELNPDVAYVDAADVKPERFSKTIRSFLPTSMRTITLISEHEADKTYPIVSAASIIAKVRRDQIIIQLKKIYGDFGSGYPSDKRTVQFLEDYVKKHRKLPDFVRKTWSTAKRIYEKYVLRKKLL